MGPRLSSGYWLVLPVLLGVLGIADPAPAQFLSKWGHPVFQIGVQPYDTTSTGQANYPGGPGFVPGYGYWPGLGPEHYPWLDGPGTPFDRRKLLLPALGAAVESPPVGALPAPTPIHQAVVVVKIPAEAMLWFDGVRTRQGGSCRVFITPPLPGGQDAIYTLRARWILKGVELQRSETVQVHPGVRSRVNFLTTDGWGMHKDAGF